MASVCSVHRPFPVDRASVAPPTTRRKTGPPQSPSRRSLEERNRLVEANLGLVGHMVAKALKRDPVKLAAIGEDLASVGYFALIRAAELFDETRGVKFSSYACFAIERRIRLSFKLDRPIRLPCHLEGEELARAIKRSYVGPLWSNPYAEHDDQHDPPAPPGPEPFAEEEQKKRQARLEGLLAQLGQRYRTVIVRRFWEGRTLREVAAELGITKEWARQIEARALTKLRAMMRGNGDAVDGDG
jgi:RNA polymerase primary sigma factor/RNA polymerase sigma factor